MKISRFSLLLLCCFMLVTGYCQNKTTRDEVVFDYTGAEKMIEWLQEMKAGASMESLEREFFSDVVTTKGYKAVLRHWSRFFEWNEEILYNWIMVRLGKKQLDNPVIERDANKEFFEYSKNLWQKALADPQKLAADLQQLKELNIKEKSIELARNHLPPEAEMHAEFYIVLFGASSAFSVGDVNGFDLLQLMRKEDGSIFTEEVMRLFAHELHHTGFSDYRENYAVENDADDKLYLLKLLVSEGTPTALINEMPEALKYLTGQVGENLRRDWEFALSNKDSLYAQVEEDVLKSMETGWTDEMFKRWMGGWQGPAYVIGVDIVKIIYENLGNEALFKTFKDVRILPETYNKAAEKVLQRGEERYLFSEEFIERLKNFSS